MELADFVRSVFSSWVEIVGIVLTVLPFLEKIPALGRRMSVLESYAKFIWIIGAVCIFFGFYSSWSMERRARVDAEKKITELSKPELSAEITFYGGGGSPEGSVRGSDGTFIFLDVIIYNTGAPTIVRDTSATVTTPDGRSGEGTAMVVPERMTIGDEQARKFTVSSKDFLNVTAAEPIPRNGEAHGFAFYMFRTLTREEILQKGSVITFRFKDVNGRQYLTKRIIEMAGMKAAWGFESKRKR
jgi:hypothetical protein